MIEFKKYLVHLFFSSYLVIGILIFRDYGISCDEPLSRLNGIVTVNYVYQKDPFLFEYVDRDYGVLFEVPLVIIERILHLSNNLPKLYYVRHLATFIIFFIGVCFFYKLLLAQFKNKYIALLGSLFLVLSPRIFAHSFYNSKDIPFLSFFIIAIYTLIRFLDTKKIKWTIIHSLSSAILINTRIIGIIILFLTTNFLLLDYLKDKKYKKKFFLLITFYLILTISIIIGLWPYLWQNPIKNFIFAWQRMSHFPWPNTVLYFGKYLSPSQLPWHYLFVWIAISTPISYLILFLIGNINIIKRLIFRPIRQIYNNRNQILYLLWFWVPVISVLLFNSNLYDEWRQLFFIYPALLIISLFGLIHINNYLQEKKLSVFQKILFLLLFIDVVLVARFMLKSHPFQNVYFNYFLSNDYSKAKQNFDFDYWGLSFRKGFEYILNKDKRKIIRILIPERVPVYGFYFLNKHEQKRIEFVKKIEEADYYITNYRWEKYYVSKLNEVYSVKVNDAKLLSVFKLK